jgi:uncharacterized membrane protein
MNKLFVFLWLVFSACTLPAEREAKKAAVKKQASTTTVIETLDTNSATHDTSSNITLPKVQKVKKPNGLYRAILSQDNNKIEQTIAFNSDLTYRLEEKYIPEDSIVISEGTWNPSDGFIWLYKDQVVRGRYKWQGNTLQYYSPQLKKSFAMDLLPEATQEPAWKSKGKEGVVVFGLGNEPFWSVEYNNKDTVSFILADWAQPVKMKIDSSFTTTDSTGYLARNDSAQIRVTVFPQFCSDGMSDFTYRHKIRVQYNKQVYSGCAITYR